MVTLNLEKSSTGRTAVWTFFNRDPAPVVGVAGRSSVVPFSSSTSRLCLAKGRFTTGTLHAGNVVETARSADRV